MKCYKQKHHLLLLIVGITKDFIKKLRYLERKGDSICLINISIIRKIKQLIKLKC